MSRKIIEQEIEFWVKKNPFYNDYFKKGFLKGIIDLCEVVTQIHPINDEVIADFIAGFALLPIYNKTKNEQQGKEFEMLTKPVIDLIIEYVKSAEYRKFIVDKEISGEATLEVNGVKSPISQKEILMHIERTKATPLTPKDISAIEKDWIEYKRMQYKTNMPPTLQHPNQEMKFYNNDPKKGGNEISFWDYLEQSGINEYFKNSGLTINPTHNFELLKQVRLELFKKAKQSFIEKRTLDKLETADLELNCLYIAWLKNELEVIEQWLSDKYPNGDKKQLPPSTSDQIEILKYQQFVNTEIKATVNLLKEIPQRTEQSQNDKQFTPEERLEYLFLHKGNIDLYNQIKHYININIDFDKYEWQLGKTKENLINLMAVNFLDEIIFPLLQAIYLFQSDPFKCITWIKGNLKRYTPDIAEFIKSLILVGLSDKKRFQDETNNLTFIYNEISNIDCLILHHEPDITYSMFEYFTGKKSYPDPQKLMNSLTAIRGHLKTESIVVKEFINEHRNEILKQTQNEFNPFLNDLLPEQIESKTEQPKLSINQIALKYVYEGEIITRNNSNKIANQYGHNSGEKLFQRFTYYSSTANRKGKPTLCTPKKLKNKIELFESITERLTDKAKSRANDEINILKTLYESEYQ